MGRSSPRNIQFSALLRQHRISMAASSSVKYSASGAARITIFFGFVERLRFVTNGLTSEWTTSERKLYNRRFFDSFTFGESFMDYLQKKIIAFLSAERDGADRAYFDLPWVKKDHRLLMLLLSVRSRDPEEQRRDFINLFQVGEKFDLLPDYQWPMETKALSGWRTFRDMTRELV